MTAFIEAKKLSKHYGHQIVLEEINAQVSQGEFVTLVGASGCGKSTLLKMLLGVEQPTTGSLTFEGNPFPSEPGPDRGIVFQRYSVFPHLTVLENIALGRELEQARLFGKLWGSAKKKALDAADYWVEAVGLGHAKNQYPHELSGGMQQRLAIAQALIKQPKVLLLDEPFGALDPGIRKDMHQLVLSLWKKHKLTVFMVTHDLAEGFYLGTRLWVFDKIRQDPHAPNRFGSTITFDLPVGETSQETFETITQSVEGQPQPELTSQE